MKNIWIVVWSLISLSHCQDLEFQYEGSCYSEGHSMSVTAKYVGSGTVSAVQWYYSKQSSNNLIVLPSTCDIAGTIDPGYPTPTSRMSFECPATDSLPTNTFKLTLSALKSSEMADSWGATFSLTTGVDPTVVQKPIPKCLTPTPTPGPKCDLLCIMIIIGVVLAVVIIGLVIGCCLDRLCRDQRKGCFNCEASDCGECCQCCDNYCVRCKCCGSCCDIKGLPFWYHILWWTVIGTAVSLGIFIRRKLIKQGNGDVKPKEEKPRHETQSGNTRTGPKKPETKKKESKDSVAHIENEQHNQGKKQREQPPLPHGAGAATGTAMHGREDSDSAVSREHVHIQESGRTLPQRPMPGIPSANDRQGHDNKGRGLSATFNDEDHPLVAIDTPSQKKGALESLPEGTGGEGSVKKLKKKKKKSKDQEDEM